MEQIQKLLKMLSVRQRWTILIAVVLASASLYAFARFEQESGFRPLYNALSPEDAAVVVQKLKEGGTPYRLSANGATISVP
jgi:flagellar biosynthesis/type III secretory pathway M-ring protein FliF/YscJ